MKSLLKIFLCSVAFTGAMFCGCLSAYSDTHSNHKPPVVKKPQLVLIKSAGEVLGDAEALYNFGEVSLMDYTIDAQDSKDITDLKPVLEGIKHIFTLKNATAAPIVITGSETDCSCLSARVWGKEVFQEFPFTVAPHREVKIIVALNQHVVVPGKIEATINLLYGGSDSERVSLVMKGNVSSGIYFSNYKLDFGKVASGSGVARTFRVNFHRYIPLNIPNTPLRFTSSNPNLRLTILPPRLKIMGLVISKDTIKFPDDEMDKDLNLEVRVDLLKTAPIGKFRSEAKLIVVGFPIYGLTYNSKISLQGEVMAQVNRSDN